MNRSFCTYFDHRYLSRGLTMYRSLKDQCPSAKLWVLCLSDECYKSLRALAWTDLITIRLKDFEEGDLQLQAAKLNRAPIEYYFTCTPSLPLFLFKNNPDMDMVTYVDADLHFFSSLEPIFEEMNAQSIAIIPHRFAQSHKWMEQDGVFNVGWLSFRRDEHGMACLQWWRERCLEWCHDYIEDGRFADQKYLDQFPKRFTNLKVIEHKGANLAAWNLSNYRLQKRDGQLWVDDQLVIFYHFHGLRKIAPGVLDPSLDWYGLRLTWFLETELFRPYIRKLRKAGQQAGTSRKAARVLNGLQRKVLMSPGQPNRTRAAAKLAVSYWGLFTRKFILSRWE